MRGWRVRQIRGELRAVSWQSFVVDQAFRALRAKQRSDSPELFQAQIDKARSKAGTRPVVPPKRVSRALDIVEETSAGMPVFELQPRVEQPTHRVVYLHGGSYTFQLAWPHWSFLSHLVREAPAHVTLPIYPLAPETSASHTVAVATDLTEQVIDLSGPSPVTLMGDSAGGGMALAVALQLKLRGKQPAAIVLNAPWLDVTMSDPRLAELDPADSLLSINGLAYAGRCYAGELDVTDPRVSPLLGPLDGLAPIDVFTGTHDVLNADAHRLVERATAAGTTVRLHEAPGMPHVYPLLAVIPEGRLGRDAIVELVRGESIANKGK
jgi:acetyl esterase/lipase